jgi:hypothetical protein
VRCKRAEGPNGSKGLNERSGYLLWSSKMASGEVLGHARHLDERAAGMPGEYAPVGVYLPLAESDEPPYA